jgi:hypothetical protein
MKYYYGDISRRMRGVGHAARMGEMKNARVGKP